MKKDQIFILEDRGIVYICGEDAKDFLQNVITNDINKTERVKKLTVFNVIFFISSPFIILK